MNLCPRPAYSAPALNPLSDKRQYGSTGVHFPVFPPPGCSNLKPSILRGFAKVLQVPPTAGTCRGFLFPADLLYICEFTFVNLLCSTWKHSRLACLRNAGSGRPPLPRISEICRERARPAPSPLCGLRALGSPRACALRLLAPSLLARSLLAPCSLLARSLLAGLLRVGVGPAPSGA